ncbi:MAG TPA: nucleotidyl transferase AbiEii/AbiGii toxin family protein [Verrucomicrobiae bacterium]|nr:nucleotidyl transferase AbiEii/AbiGii toxin family protein [Verrucomicrobiae bacterium]
MALIRSSRRAARKSRPVRRGNGSNPNRSRLDLAIASAPFQFRWASAISKEEWAFYQRAIEAMQKSDVPFLLGGGFALAVFTGHWRDTKDIDFYIAPEHRDRFVAALSDAGFLDYYSRLPYDRKWIYRSVQSDVIVDIIWSMANQRAQVDDLWFQRARSVSIRRQEMRVVPPEELLWCKLYILQRDHCDWTDVFNLIYAKGAQLDWQHLIWRLEDDTPLLRAVLTVYAWLCPGAARKLPASLWRRLNMAKPAATSGALPRERIRLLDSRRWFAALQPLSEKLEI